MFYSCICGIIAIENLLQVPGKSQQDCFDRIHCDYMTPPETQPRLRAKTFKSSPIHQFSISASKLLKPMDKTARRSNVLKPKNIITQKSVDKLLQRHLKVDLDREGDIFSVLEPNTKHQISQTFPFNIKPLVSKPLPNQTKSNFQNHTHNFQILLQKGVQNIFRTKTTLKVSTFQILLHKGGSKHVPNLTKSRT